jgi:intracellular multiplication protein IcmE
MSEDDNTFEEDMEEEALDFDEDFEDFGSGEGKTLGDLWQENAMFKVGAIVLGLLVLIFVFSLFGGNKEEAIPSMVAPAESVSAAPGTEEASPAYIEAVEEENEMRVEEAIKEGGSALPTPIEPPIGRLTVPEEEKEKEDPLQKWRRLQEERLERELQQAKTVTQTNLDGTGAAGTEAMQAIAESMSTQMQAIIERQNAAQPGTSSITITSPSYLAQLLQDEQAQAQAQAQANEELSEDQNPGLLLVPATEIEYAQTLIEANSDVPGPVLAQIVSGTLKGAKILGSFSKSEELLTLTFSSAVINDEVIPINAIALDPATSLPAMATDVDYRYFRRIVLPAAASFIEGMASAIEESGRTTVTVSRDTVAEETEETSDEQEVASGVTEAGQKIGEILDDMADVETLVRIRSGTPMALLFLDPVYYVQASDPQFPPVMNSAQ